MTQHHLINRREDEVLWYQRRSFLAAAAAWTSMGGFEAAQAQQRSNVVFLQGDALINGQRLLPQQNIQTGDQIATGPGSSLIFVMGGASFQVRENSRLVMERGNTLTAVGLLRLITGAVGSVWSKGPNRRIITPTLTVGIRGTGVYTEVFPTMDNRTYFCNCYGTTDVSSGTDKVVSTSSYHQAFWCEPTPKDGRTLNPAPAVNHTDDEMEYLASLINQKTAWQIMGKRGKKDGMGTMDDAPGFKHPATNYF